MSFLSQGCEPFDSHVDCSVVSANHSAFEV